MSITRLPFEEVFADESGGNIKTPQSEYLREGRFPVVDQGKALIAGYVDEEEIVCGGGRPAIVFGDHTRCVKYINQPFCMGADGVKVLRPKIDADLKYLYYYLKQLQLPDAGYDRHFKYLKRTEVVLFPLAEQRRIAAILDKADALRTKRREALAQLDRLAQSIFVEMFGDPATNPHGWVCKSLGAVVKTTSGGTPDRSSRAYFGGSIPWVKSGELHQRILHETEEHITELGLANSSAKLVPPGTVLVAMYGATVGAISQLAVHAATNQAICCMQPSGEVDSIYLIGFLRQYTPTLLARRVGGAQPNLSQDLLRNIKIPLPPIEMQREFKRRLDSIKCIETSCQQSTVECDALFASIQHRAFRGEL